MTRIALQSVLLVAFVIAGMGGVKAAVPCCSVVAIDAARRTVTAKESATGRTFEFKVADARMLATVKIGQAIGADFKNMKVFLEPDAQEPCCSLTNLKAPVR